MNYGLSVDEQRIASVIDDTTFMRSDSGIDWLTHTDTPTRMRDISSEHSDYRAIADSLSSYPLIDLGCGNLGAVRETVRSVRHFVGESLPQPYIGVDKSTLFERDGSFYPMYVFDMGGMMPYDACEEYRAMQNSANDSREKSKDDSYEAFRAVPNIHFVRSDLLEFLVSLEDSCANINLMGFESGLIVNSKENVYQAELQRQISRVLAPRGVFFEGANGTLYDGVPGERKKLSPISYYHLNNSSKSVGTVHTFSDDVEPEGAIFNFFPYLTSSQPFRNKQFGAIVNELGEHGEALLKSIGSHISYGRDVPVDEVVSRLKVVSDKVIPENHELLDVIARTFRSATNHLDSNAFSLSSGLDLAGHMLDRPSCLDDVRYLYRLWSFDEILNMLNREDLQGDELSNRANVKRALAHIDGGDRIENEVFPELVSHLETIVEHAGHSVSELPFTEELIPGWGKIVVDYHEFEARLKICIAENDVMFF